MDWLAAVSLRVYGEDNWEDINEGASW